MKTILELRKKQKIKEVINYLEEQGNKQWEIEYVLFQINNTMKGLVWLNEVTLSN